MLLLLLSLVGGPGAGVGESTSQQHNVPTFSTHLQRKCMFVSRMESPSFPVPLFLSFFVPTMDVPVCARGRRLPLPGNVHLFTLSE